MEKYKMETYIVEERKKDYTIEYVIKVYRGWSDIYTPSIADITHSIGIEYHKLKETSIGNGRTMLIRTDAGVGELRDELAKQNFVEEKDFDIKEDSLIFYDKKKAEKCITDFLEPRRLAVKMINNTAE